MTASVPLLALSSSTEIWSPSCLSPSLHGGLYLWEGATISPSSLKSCSPGYLFCCSNKVTNAVRKREDHTYGKMGPSPVLPTGLQDKVPWPLKCWPMLSRQIYLSEKLSRIASGCWALEKEVWAKITRVGSTEPNSGQVWLPELQEIMLKT